MIGLSKASVLGSIVLGTWLMLLPIRFVSNLWFDAYLVDPGSPQTQFLRVLQIVLIGQPELQELLQRPDLRQLTQRITARYHLTPLSEAETNTYVHHRLSRAGRTTPLFTPAALKTVHRLSGGIPRLTNIICERSLLAAYALQSPQIGPGIVRKAATEVYEHYVFGCSE